MRKFVPREKLSKKAKRELDKQARKMWGTLNPVTRKAADPGIYKRKRFRIEDYDSAGTFL
ncbi:MAG: hypothetical protein PHZ09_13590 [Eubacteriales bacterium]|jgi:hypothetical protein|nr:hypothetical protein [Eubacteriales bacterium]